MRTARFSGSGGGLPDPPPPREADPHAVNRMTDKCKNITLPQTSYAGGKWFFTPIFSFLGATAKQSDLAVVFVCLWTLKIWKHLV